MFGLDQYEITRRREYWPSGECLVIDPSSGTTVGIVREEPWPEVILRPYPDGTKGRPWLMRLFGVDHDPARSRTVVRREPDGLPLLRLHHRQPLFNRTVGLFDSRDKRVGYVSWSFKGGGPADSFDLFGIDHKRIVEVRRKADGVYRVAEEKDGLEWAVVSLTPNTCTVALNEAIQGRDQEGVFLLSAAIMLLEPK